MIKRRTRLPCTHTERAIVNRDSLESDGLRRDLRLNETERETRVDGLPPVLTLNIHLRLREWGDDLATRKAQERWVQKGFARFIPHQNLEGN